MPYRSLDEAAIARTIEAVNEVEDLTSGLSRKIWQKLSVVYAMGPGAAGPGSPVVGG